MTSSQCHYRRVWNHRCRVVIALLSIAASCLPVFWAQLGMALAVIAWLWLPEWQGWLLRLLNKG